MPRGTDLYDEARLQGRLWTPDMLRAAGKLARWYDASDRGTITIATGVSTWKDKTGIADAAQGTAGNQPATYNLTGWLPGTKSMPAVIPDGGDFMTYTSVAYSGSPGLGVFAVTQVGSGITRCIVGGSASGSGALTYNGLGQVLIVSAGVAIRFTSSGNLVLGGHNVWGMEVATNLCRAWLNGVAESSGTDPAFTQPLTRLFSQNGANLFTLGAGEILITNTTLPTWEALKVQAYLAWKWGTIERLAYSNPYKRRPPLVGD